MQEELVAISRLTSWQRGSGHQTICGGCTGHAQRFLIFYPVSLLPNINTNSIATKDLAVEFLIKF